MQFFSHFTTETRFCLFERAWYFLNPILHLATLAETGSQCKTFPLELGPTSLKGVCRWSLFGDLKMPPKIRADETLALCQTFLKPAGIQNKFTPPAFSAINQSAPETVVCGGQESET